MKIATLNISSEKFTNGSMIPAKYTLNGNNINPPLEIENLPFNTESLVVMLVQKPVQKDEILLWLKFNIHVKNVIEENEMEGECGLNFFNKTNYMGPSSYLNASRYFFKVYALDDFLYFDSTAVKKCEVEEAIMYHIVGYGELETFYLPSVKLEHHDGDLAM